MQINVSKLEDILAARERREKKRISLIREYHLPVVSFTLNIPGPAKDNQLYRKIFDKGMEEINIALGEGTISHREIVYLTTGPEAFLCVDKVASQIKAETVQIEKNHPLGRLFDYDVFDISFAKLNRTEMGFPERCCLICEEKAVICARSKKHNLEELLDYIAAIANIYFSNEK